MNLANICRFFIDEDFRIRVKTKLGLCKRMSDQDYVRMLFKANLGYEPNLENPSSFSEKLQWLKLHDRRPEYTVMADKYLAKQYIADRIGAQYVIPLLGVWRSADEIDFDRLPKAFVLKCNHNSGGVKICRDKSRLDFKKTRKALGAAIKEDYYAYGREWPYKDIPRRIIAEQYLEEAPGEVLWDYKFFCFGGKPKFLYAATDSCGEDEKETFLTIDWEYAPFERLDYPKHDVKPSKPRNLEQMIEISKMLSKDIPFIRVDFYEAQGRLYVGELTFFPGSGILRIKPEEYSLVLGEWIQLPVSQEGLHNGDCIELPKEGAHE